MRKIIKFTDKDDHTIYFDYESVINSLKKNSYIVFKYYNNKVIKTATPSQIFNYDDINTVGISCKSILLDGRFDIIEIPSDRDEFDIVDSLYLYAKDAYDLLQDKITVYMDAKYRNVHEINI